MRFIHLTDPHLSSLADSSLLSLYGKRWSGYLSWTFKRQHIYRSDTLDLLTEAIRAEAADQLILSGDLVQIGLEQEIREAGNWLSGLAPPERIFFVPGNHDVYAADSWAAIRRHWKSVLPQPPEGRKDSSISAYPIVRDLGNVRLIGASSACVTPIFSSRGALGQDQIDRLVALIRECHETGMMPCIAIHHPPLPHMSPWTKALRENQLLSSVIASHQPSVVWCGHQHQNLDVIEGQTRVFCTASASSNRNASYRIFDIEPITKGGRQSWNIHMSLKKLATGGSGFRVAREERWSFSR